jgi:hypothetical protein
MMRVLIAAILATIARILSCGIASHSALYALSVHSNV